MSYDTQLVLSLIVSFLMGWWASSLAEKSGKKPRKWFLLGFLFGLFAIFYLLVVIRFFKKSEVSTVVPLQMASPSIGEAFMKQWFYLDGQHQQQGPVGFHYLQGKVFAKEVMPSTYVWAEGMEEWKRIAEIPGLLNAFEQRP